MLVPCIVNSGNPRETRSVSSCSLWTGERDSFESNNHINDYNLQVLQVTGRRYTHYYEYVGEDNLDRSFNSFPEEGMIRLEVKDE